MISLADLGLSKTYRPNKPKDGRSATVPFQPSNCGTPTHGVRVQPTPGAYSNPKPIKDQHPNSDLKPIFDFDGNRWSLRFQGLTIVEKQRAGLKHIKCLLIDDQNDIHCSQLILRSTGEPEEIMTEEDLLESGSGMVIENGCDHDGNIKASINTGEADIEVVSPEAIQRISATLVDLREQLTKFESRGLPHQASALADDIQLIEQYLKEASYNGAPVYFPSRTERDRKSVSKAIREAIEHIRKKHPALAEHLKQTIHLGTYCSYKPILAEVADAHSSVAPE